MDVLALKNLTAKIELLARKVAEKARPTVTLKRPGNQAQYEYCSQILKNLDGLEESVTAGRKSQAMEQIADIREFVELRIKHIRVADESIYGWDTVNEYMTSELASDSEDERKIRRAENRASVKRKRRMADKAPFKRFHADDRDQPSTSNRNFFRGGALNRARCFSCGKVGHFRNACPEGKTPAETKPESKTA